MNTPDNKGAREYWIHEWTDSQPEGFLSGEVRHTIEFDVSLHPRAGFTRVIDYRALTSALERIESLREALSNYVDLRYNGVPNVAMQALTADDAIRDKNVTNDHVIRADNVNGDERKGDV